MVWNWQLPEWPEFTYSSAEIQKQEAAFLQGAGGLFAVLKHLSTDEKQRFIVEILSMEGLYSAEIEGEILERESLQSSIQRHFGLKSPKKSRPQEEGMASLMYKMFDQYDKALTHEMLFDWHSLLMGYAKGWIDNIGCYRNHSEPMQIISNRYNQHKVFYEAPPSKSVQKEMSQYIDWFNNYDDESSILAHAAIAHAYFESIHPFEDGNGRIGRVLIEKYISQRIGRASLTSISQVITRRKKDYYAALGSINHSLDARRWVHFFANVMVEAQEESLAWVNFLVSKSSLMNALKDQINPRQEKVLLRLFAEGIKGFSGGLSAENYTAITKTSRATATRDLADLIEKGALRKTGTLRYTRYWLNIPNMNDKLGE